MCNILISLFTIFLLFSLTYYSPKLNVLYDNICKHFLPFPLKTINDPQFILHNIDILFIIPDILYNISYLLYQISYITYKIYNIAYKIHFIKYKISDI